MVASTKFIAGEPMKPATKGRAAAREASGGVDLQDRPSRITATRWPSNHRFDLVVRDVHGRDAGC
jgi:hypothetical protein